MSDTMSDVIPRSIRELINEWMTESPGWYTGAEIAAGVRRMAPTRPRIESAVYEELGRMAGGGGQCPRAGEP